MFTPQHLPQHHRSTGFNHLLPYLLFLLSPGIFPILLAFTQLEEPPSPSATFALIVDGEKTFRTWASLRFALVVLVSLGFEVDNPYLK